MNILHTISAFFKRTRRDSYQDPTRDWLFLITTSTIILAGLIVWGVWAFDTVAGGGTIGTAVKTTAPPLDTSSLTTIRSVFESRAAEKVKYTTGTYRFADPSQ